MEKLIKKMIFALLVLRFTPSQAGMRIQVICKDGPYYSWTSGTKSETWVDAGYQKITGAPSRIE